MDGFFYIIQLAPDAYPNRLKLGFSNNPVRRLGIHRTAAPTAQLLGSWPCPRKEESRVINALTQAGCRHVAGEVYDADDPKLLCSSADKMFPRWAVDGFPVDLPPAPKRETRDAPSTYFREMTDGLPAIMLARAMGVKRQTIHQYRLSPDSAGYRAPPKGWRNAVACVNIAVSRILIGVERDLMLDFPDEFSSERLAEVNQTLTRIKETAAGLDWGALAEQPDLD